MAVRRESVEVRYDSNIAAGASRDAAAVANLNRALDGLSGHRFFQSPPGGGAIQAYQRQADGASGSINQLTGRLSLLGDTLLGLAPAGVALGAVSVQGIGGITAAATAALVAGGAAVVAFQGVGDAVKAVNEYQLDPTVENLEKAQAALEALDPAAERFVMRFQEFQPVLTELRNAAAQGLFDGGLTASLDDFEAAAPRIQALLAAGGRAGGIVAEDVAGALASDRWEDFLTFLTDETPDAMASLSRTTGALTHGISEMFMALDPGNDAFLGWLEDVTAQFDRYASSAEGAEDITAILDYARETGPDLAELFSSTASGLAALARAAAPLGGPVLDGLTAVTDLIGTVADSDLGTPIIAGVLALRLYTRAAALATAAQARLTGAIGATAAQSARAAAANGAGMAGVPPHLRGAFAAPHPSQVRADRRAAALRGAGMAVGLGAAMSGVAEEVGLMNTAVLSMAGPIGTGVGLLLDFAQHTNRVEDAQKNLNAVLADSSSTFAQYVAAQDAMSEARRSYLDDYGSVGDLTDSLLTNPVETMKESWKLGLDSLDGTNDRLNEAGALTKTWSDETTTLGRNYLNLAASLGGEQLSAAEMLSPDPEKVQAAIDQLAGPLAELGVTTQDLESMTLPEFNQLTEDLQSLNGPLLNSTSLLRGFTASLQGAQDFLDGRAGWRSYEAAIDAATASLKENGRTLDRNTPKGRANADALDAIATSGMGIANGMKEGSQRQKTYLRELRRQLTETAGAFGMTRPQIAAFLDGLNLIDRRAIRVRTALNTLPKDVRTKVITDGVPKTMAEVRDLVREYKLTEKERRALVRLMNAEKTKADARALAAVLDQAARDREATITITTNRRINEIRTLSQDIDIPRVGGRADGGTIPGQRHPYRDRDLYLLAPGEEVISNRYGQADRHRALLKAINADGLAGGGTAGGRRFASSARRAAEAAAGRSGSRVEIHHHPNDIAGMTIRGKVDTGFGLRDLEAVVVDVARREIDADRQFEGTHG